MIKRTGKVRKTISRRNEKKIFKKGVTLIDPSSVFSKDTKIGKDVIFILMYILVKVLKSEIRLQLKVFVILNLLK